MVYAVTGSSCGALASPSVPLEGDVAKNESFDTYCFTMVMVSSGILVEDSSDGPQVVS